LDLSGIFLQLRLKKTTDKPRIIRH